MSDQVDLSAILGALTSAVEAMNAQTAAVLELAAQSSQPAVDLKNPEGLMSVKEFCERVQIKKSRLYELMKEGGVRFIQYGGRGSRIWFRPKDLEWFLDRWEVKPKGLNVVRRRRFSSR